VGIYASVAAALGELDRPGRTPSNILDDSGPQEKSALLHHDIDARLAAILGPNLQAATQRLIAYFALGTTVGALIISVL